MSEGSERNEFLEAYRRAIEEAREEIAMMRGAHARGEDLVPNLPAEVGDSISFRFLDDLESRAPDNDAWDVDFEWRWSQALFTIRFAPSQNMGGDEPFTGWTTWVNGDLLVAFVDENNPSASAMFFEGASPFTGEDSEDDPRLWVELARILLRAMTLELEPTKQIEPTWPA